MPDDSPPSPSGRDWLDLRLRGRRAAEADLQAEIETHLAMRVERLMARGLPREEALRRAREHFGDFDAAMRRLQSSVHTREVRMDRRERRADVAQDLMLTARLFRRAPVFYALILLTLALGIGANGAVFSILRATLLQPLPYRAPDELILLWGEARGQASRPLPGSAALHLGRDGATGLLGDVAGVVSWQTDLEPQLDLAVDDRTERLRGALVTPNFFDLLGVRPSLGRTFTTADEARGGTLLVLSHALWQRAFGGDPAIVGRSRTLVAGMTPRQARSFTIIGVLPAEFRFTYPEETEAWVMMPWHEAMSVDPRLARFQVIGRLAPGASLDQLTAYLRHWADQDPANRPALRAEPIREWVVGETRPSLLLLAGVALLLLLVTCVTVANALLTRLSERRQELALRASLGADRGRLVRQLLTEGAVLSVGGAVAGTAVAVALHPVLRALLPPSIPTVGAIGVNPSIVGFAAVMAAITTMLAALVPAFAGVRDGRSGDFLRATARASADRRTTRYRQGLVAAQAAIATLLLIAATLLLTSLWRLGQVPLGFDGTRVATVEMRLLDPRYRDQGTLGMFQEELVRRVAALPGVSDVGLTSAVPFRGVDFMLVPQRLDTEQRHPVRGRYVDAGYFRVLQIPLLAGRLLSPDDRPGTPRVMLVSEAYAREVFGTDNPVGRFLEFDGPTEIVGVVGDTRYAGLDRAPEPAIYLSHSQSPNTLICLVVRVDLPAQQLGTVYAGIRRVIHEIDPWIPAMRFTTVEAIVDGSVAGRRFYTVATAAFAVVALILTIVGLAVVVARAVVERRRELAIRMALGASQGRVVRQAGRDGLLAVGAGIGVGLLGAYAGATLLSQFLFGVTPYSPISYGGAAALVGGATLAAAWLVARRVTRIALAETLKAE